MNIVSQSVKHIIFGEGIVTKHEANHITVQFPCGEKVFSFPQAFQKHLIALDTGIQASINELLIPKPIVIQSSNPKTSISSVSTNKTINSSSNRSTAKQYHFVFQNKTFIAERNAGILWAPKLTEDERHVSHWDRVADVRTGDVIIHSFQKEIVAFSIALEHASSMRQPDSLKHEKLWSDDGWGVHCQYISIQYPIVTSDYMDKLLELQPEKYAPFNRIGRGNTGYLFAVNYDFAKFLFDLLTKKNPYLLSHTKELGFD